AQGDHAKTMVGARVRRQQVAYVRSRGLSSRRACALLSIARSTVGYVSRLQARDAPGVSAMREIAAQYPRYGYRKVRIFLARRGHARSGRIACGAKRACKYRAPSTSPGRHEPTASGPAAGDQSRLGLRLRLRHLRRWLVAEMLDRRR